MNYPKKSGIITKEAILGISDPSVFQSPPPRVFSTFENYFKSPSLVPSSSLSSSVVSHPIQTPRANLSSFLAPSPLINKNNVKERVPLSLNQNRNQIHLSGFKASDDFEKLVSASPVPLPYGCSVFSENTSINSDSFPARSFNSEGFSKLRQTFQDSSLKQGILTSDSSFVKNSFEKNLSEKIVDLPKHDSNLAKSLSKRVLRVRNVNLPKQRTVSSNQDKDILISKFVMSNKKQTVSTPSEPYVIKTATQGNAKKAAVTYIPQPISSSLNKAAPVPTDDTSKRLSDLLDKSVKNNQNTSTKAGDSDFLGQELYEPDDTLLPPEEEAFANEPSLLNKEPAPKQRNLAPTNVSNSSKQKNETQSKFDFKDQRFVIQGQLVKTTRSGRVVSKPRQYWKNEPTPPSTIQLSLEWGAAEVKITKLAPAQLLNSPLPAQEKVSSNSRTNINSNGTRDSKLKRALPSGPSKIAQSGSNKKVQKKNNLPSAKNKTNNVDFSLQPKKKTNRINIPSSPNIPTLGIASPGILKPFNHKTRDNYSKGLKNTLVSVQSKKQINNCKKKPAKKSKSSVLQQVLDGNASHLFERRYDDDSETDSPNNYYGFSD